MGKNGCPVCRGDLCQRSDMIDVMVSHDDLSDIPGREPISGQGGLHFGQVIRHGCVDECRPETREDNEGQVHYHRAKVPMECDGNDVEVFGNSQAISLGYRSGESKTKRAENYRIALLNGPFSGFTKVRNLARNAINTITYVHGIPSWARVFGDCALPGQSEVRGSPTRAPKPESDVARDVRPDDTVGHGAKVALHPPLASEIQSLF